LRNTTAPAAHRRSGYYSGVAARPARRRNSKQGIVLRNHHNYVKAVRIAIRPYWQGFWGSKISMALKNKA